MKSILLLFSFLFSFNAFNQNIGTPAPRYNDTVLVGYELYEQKNFKGAIEKYTKVPEGDSMYSLARYERALCEFHLKNYRNTLLLNKEAVAERDIYTLQHYELAANVYLEQGIEDSLLHLIDEGMQAFPYHYGFYNTLAQHYLGKKEYDKGLSFLKKSLTINPYGSSTHKKLGDVFIQSGLPSLSLMALQIAAVTETSMPIKVAIIDQMEKIADGQYKPEHHIPKDIFLTPEGIKELDEIVNSRVASTASYKGVTKINYSIVKQLQIISEKLPAIDTSNFFINFYYKYYHQVWNQKQFEPMILLFLSDLGVPEVEKQLVSKKKAVEAYRIFASNFLGGTRRYLKELTEPKFNGMSLHFDLQNLTSIGKLEEGKKVGKWFLLDQGKIESEGEYVKDQKQGIWISYFNNNGKVAGKEIYEAGILSGSYTYYYPNGFLKEEGHWMQNKREGLVKTYHPNGAPKDEFHYKNDILEGPAVAYAKEGYKIEEYTYHQGKMEGEMRRYNHLESLVYKGFYKNDFLEGRCTSFYPNGAKESEFTLTKGKAFGTFISYFEGGNIKNQGEFKNDIKTGSWKEYHENGKLASDELYENDKLNGSGKYFDEDGLIYAQFEYRDNKINSYTYFDKKGKVLSQGTPKGGKLMMVKYLPNGVIESKVETINGKAEGIYKSYYASGKTDFEVPMKEGLKEGIERHYYKNGNTKLEVYYNAGRAEGFSRAYYPNGRIQAEGYYLNDQKHGTWKYYFINGKLDSEEYYDHGLLNGLDKEYALNGKLSTLTYSEQDVKSEIYSYDSAGNVIAKTIFGPEETVFQESFIISKTAATFNYKHGYLHGPQILYYAKEKVKSEMNYVHGQQEGIRKTYHPNGKLANIGKYYHDTPDSIWIYYDEEGNKRQIENYKNGELNGPLEVFYENGIKEATLQYKDGKRDGECIFYGPEGETQVKLIYKDGTLIAYTYQDKNKTYLQPIELKEETGPIKTYYHNGNVALETSMKDGNYNGTYKEYYLSGQVFKDYSYLGEGQNGFQHVYFKSGKGKEKYYCEDDTYNGEYNYYYENGNIRHKRWFYYGQMNGTSTSYSIDGKIISEKKYYLGYEF